MISCNGCDHEQQLLRSETKVCMHPEKGKVPCPILMNDMLKAVIKILMKTAYDKHTMTGTKHCTYCGAYVKGLTTYEQHDKNCPVKVIENYK